jgi:hypothetical protein
MVGATEGKSLRRTKKKPFLNPIRVTFVEMDHFHALLGAKIAVLSRKILSWRQRDPTWLPTIKAEQ